MNKTTTTSILILFLILFSCSNNSKNKIDKKIGVWNISDFEIIDTTKNYAKGNGLLFFLALENIPKPHQIQIQIDSIKLIDQDKNVLLSNKILNYSRDTIFLDGIYGVFKEKDGDAEFNINNISYKLSKQ